MEDRNRRLLMAAAFMASTFLAHSSSVSADGCDADCQYSCYDRWYCAPGSCQIVCVTAGGVNQGCTYTCYSCAS